MILQEPKSKYIWITTEFIGFHKYPTAPQKVDYLRNKHRHLFKVKVKIEVRHNNRDIEFHIAQKELMFYIRKHLEFQDLGSCEDIAQDIAEFIMDKYPNRKVTVEVWEDGENGAGVEYEPRPIRGNTLV